jgi:hypothetical protein
MAIVKRGPCPQPKKITLAQEFSSLNLVWKKSGVRLSQGVASESGDRFINNCCCQVHPGFREKFGIQKYCGNFLITIIPSAI